MRFDVYFAEPTAKGLRPGVTPEPMEWSDIKKQILENENWAKQIDDYRETGDTELKQSLPSINFVGRSVRDRANNAMIPTQLFMIDIDHIPEDKDCRQVWDTLCMKVDYDWIVDNVILAHISPSGHGIHIIFKSQGYPTLIENMNAVNEIFNFDEYGKYDTKVKDFARVSFAFKASEILFESARLLLSTESDFGTSLVNDAFAEEIQDGDSSKTPTKTKASRTISGNVPELSDEEIKKYEQMEFRGTPLINIVKKWVEHRGTPDAGEVHNYYNEMIKYFRNITSNNRKWLFAILPKFGHSDEECWSQIVSITKANTLSRIDKEFYFWLRDSGFWVAREGEANALKEYMMSDEEKDSNKMPALPPVFREFVKSAPKDFHLSVINALMAIMGFLSTYVNHLCTSGNG